MMIDLSRIKLSFRTISGSTGCEKLTSLLIKIFLNTILIDFVAKLCPFRYFTISFPVGSQTGSLKHVNMEVEFNSSDPEIFVTIVAEKHQK